MLEEFVFAGTGGQGVMFAGQLLAYAAMDEGLEVTWIPSYGPEMRGGTAHCMVVISDRPIGSPLAPAPQIAVVFNTPSFEKYEPVIAQDGVLVVNESLIQCTSHRSDLTELRIPATQLASQSGNIRVANIILLGAALAAHYVLPLDAIRRALVNHLPEHHRAVLPLNLQALELGINYSEDRLRT